MHTAFVREAALQEKLDRRIRCNVCARRCLIIDGGLGWCRTRQHRAGKLVTLSYGAVSSLAPNPIEKKPFYHFWPGTSAFTAGSWSCNFGCPWCQNWDISKSTPPDEGRYLGPEEFVAMAEAMGCEGTSISFNEPTLSLEWSLDVFRLAHARRLYNTYVTNGYMTPEALELLVDSGLDAMNVDIKGDAGGVRHYCKGIDIENVWHVCELARQRGVYIETTTLVIPTVNDSDEVLRGIARRIVRDLGPDVPWHISAYFPAYHFHAPHTPIQTLEGAWKIGQRSGLEFVYAGNAPGNPHDHTYCPGCGSVLIRRSGFEVQVNRIRSGRCPKCGREIPGVWKRGAAPTVDQLK